MPHVHIVNCGTEAGVTFCILKRGIAGSVCLYFNHTMIDVIVRKDHMCMHANTDRNGP